MDVTGKSTADTVGNKDEMAVANNKKIVRRIDLRFM